MLKDDIVEAVIGLAPNLFYGAGIPACVLVVTKSKPAHKRGQVMIINGAEECKEGKAQNVLTPENVRRFVEIYGNWEEVERFARVVKAEEIAENEYNLNIARYVGIAEEEEQIDVAAEMSVLRGLMARRDEAEAVMWGHLKELGYDS